MYVKSCRKISGISDYFLVRTNIHQWLLVKWGEKRKVTQQFDIEKFKKRKNAVIDYKNKLQKSKFGNNINLS